MFCHIKIFMSMKTLTTFEKQKISNEIKLMLFAARDFLKNTNRLEEYKDSFPIYDAGGYYGEAFGIIRCLVNLGYGKLGADNGNGLKQWFNQLQFEVLKEEKEYGLEKRFNYYRRIVSLNNKYNIEPLEHFIFSISEIKNIISELKEFDEVCQTITLQITSSNILKIENTEIIDSICKNSLETKETIKWLIEFTDDYSKFPEECSTSSYLECVIQHLVNLNILDEGHYVINPW